MTTQDGGGITFSNVHIYCISCSKYLTASESVIHICDDRAESLRQGGREYS